MREKINKKRKREKERKKRGKKGGELISIKTRALGQPDQGETSRARSWTSPGRSWRARGVPRSLLSRLWRVQVASRTRPDASLNRAWTPKTGQDRFSNDFSSIWLGFSVISDRLLVDFRSIFIRLWCCALCFRLRPSCVVVLPEFAETICKTQTIK